MHLFRRSLGSCGLRDLIRTHPLRQTAPCAPGPDPSHATRTRLVTGAERAVPSARIASTLDAGEHARRPPVRSLACVAPSVVTTKPRLRLLPRIALRRIAPRDCGRCPREDALVMTPNPRASALGDLDATNLYAIFM